ncbi:MAG: L,D-transpeptidase [Nocardiopsaceae bacterium]|nr:L,D-transpeptidase [Nocardiopsaceae bacterium]
MHQAGEPGGALTGPRPAKTGAGNDTLVTSAGADTGSGPGGDRDRHHSCDRGEPGGQLRLRPADAARPAGAYFLAFFEKPVSPGYGPFIIVTSAHSATIGDSEGSGDALAGNHGPLGGDAAIGTAGARLSHGCIRLHVPALTQLRDLPAGTPLTITP